MPIVYITATAEIPSSLLTQVLRELSGVAGPIKFIPVKAKKAEATAWMATLEAPHYGASFYSIPQLVGLSVAAREHFIECKKEDFVITLTGLPNGENWFSATDGRDTFITTRGWDSVFKRDPYCSMAYQILENVFQAMIGISYENAGEHRNVHHKAIGCINDMCSVKSDIHLKMATGNICQDCLDFAMEQKVSGKILRQIESLIDAHRKVLRRPNREIPPQHAYADRRGKVFIGEQELDLTPNHRLLFVFHLMNDGPVKIFENGRRPLLNAIANAIGRVTQESINSLAHRYEHNNFNVTKRELNKRLIDQLGNGLSRYYTISPAGRGLGYTMNLPAKFRSWHDNLNMGKKQV